MPFELNLQNFLWIQGLLILGGVLFLLWKPKSKKGMRLQLDKTFKTDSSSLANLVEFKEKNSSRSLQVFFNYNGHTFEAYEVLGIPAGASLAAVERAFREQRTLADSESRPFLEAAFAALKSSLKSSKN